MSSRSPALRALQRAAALPNITSDQRDRYLQTYQTMAAKSAVVETDEGGPVKLVSSTTGAQVVKGGQKFNESFFSAVKACYTNSVYGPAIVTFYVIAIAVLLADKPGADGPLEIMISRFNSTAYNSPVAARAAVAGMLVNGLQLLVDMKTLFVVGVLWFTPLIFKPSSYNFLFASVGSLFLLAWGAVAPYIMIIASQSFYLYTQLRSPTYRFIVIAIAGAATISYFTVPQSDYHKQFHSKLVNKFALPKNTQISDLSHFMHEGTAHTQFRLFQTQTDSNGVVTEVPTFAYTGTYMVPDEILKAWLALPHNSEFTETIGTYILTAAGKRKWKNTEQKRARLPRSVSDENSSSDTKVSTTVTASPPAPAPAASPSPAPPAPSPSLRRTGSGKQ
nr:coat protein [Recilia dorsalis filamentous virus]